MKKTWLTVIIILIALGGGWWLWRSHQTSENASMSRASDAETDSNESSPSSEIIATEDAEKEPIDPVFLALEYFDKQQEEVDGFPHDDYFVDYEDFGSETLADGGQVLYLWIIGQAYQVEGSVYTVRSSVSAPYKFIVKDGTVVSSQTAADGADYLTSLHEIFPSDVAQKMEIFDVSSLNEKVQTFAAEAYATRAGELTIDQ